MDKIAYDRYDMPSNQVLATLEMVKYGVNPAHTKLGKQLTDKLYASQQQLAKSYI